MVESLQELTDGLPAIVQWIGVVLAGAIPFVESYFASVIGILAGLNPVVAVVAAVLGNVVAVLVVILLTDRTRNRLTRPQADADADAEPSPRRQRLRRMFDRYGVPGVALVGPSVLPSHLTSAALVSFGAPARAVAGWHVVSIVLWGTAFGLAAYFGIGLLG